MFILTPFVIQYICEIIGQWLNKDNNEHSEIEVLSPLNRPCERVNCSADAQPDAIAPFLWSSGLW